MQDAVASVRWKGKEQQKCGWRSHEKEELHALELENYPNHSLRLTPLLLCFPFLLALSLFCVIPCYLFYVLRPLCFPRVGELFSPSAALGLPFPALSLTQAHELRSASACFPLFIIFFLMSLHFVLIFPVFFSVSVLRASALGFVASSMVSCSVPGSVLTHFLSIMTFSSAPAQVAGGYAMRNCVYALETASGNAWSSVVLICLEGVIVCSAIVDGSTAIPVCITLLLLVLSPCLYHRICVMHTSASPFVPPSSASLHFFFS